MITYKIRLASEQEGTEVSTSVDVYGITDEALTSAFEDLLRQVGVLDDQNRLMVIRPRENKDERER